MSQKHQGIIWNVSEENFIKYVKESNSWKEVLQKCGYNNFGNPKTAKKKRVSHLELDTAHLSSGQNWAKGKKLMLRRWKLNDILVKNSAYTGKLKKRLVGELQWKEKCSMCNLSEWLGGKIPLELDHINGDHFDNRINNIRLLCPNCHALTETYKGKNIKRKPKIQNECKDCGIKVVKTSSRCNPCSKNYVKNNRKKQTAIRDVCGTH